MGDPFFQLKWQAGVVDEVGKNRGGNEQGE